MERGNISDADTFASKIAEYYERTVIQGAPSGIPLTLPAPALSGAPGTISLGATDAYTKPFSITSQQRMYNLLAKYYVGRELLLGQQDIDSATQTLQQIIRKQKFNVQRIKVLTRKANEIRSQLKELPDKLENLKQLAKEILLEYKTELNTLGESIQSGEAVQFNLAGARELQLIQTINSLDISNIPAVIKSVQDITGYLKVQGVPFRRAQQTETGRVAFVVKQIREVLSAIIDPAGFGSFIARLTSDKASIQTKIESAKLAYLEFKQIQDTLEPALRVLDQRIEEIKRTQLDRVKALISDQKAKIQKKVANRLKTKKAAEKKGLFKQAAEDLRAFKKENASEIKKLRTKQKTITQLITRSNQLIRGVVAVKDDLLDREIPQIKQTLMQTYTNVSGSIVNASNQIGESKNLTERYFNLNELGEFATPFVELGTSLNINYQDLRVFLEQKEDKYDAYKEQIVAFKKQFFELIELAKTLDDEPVNLQRINEDSYTKLRREIKKEVDRKQRIADRKRVFKTYKAKATQSIISILQDVNDFIQRIRSWIEKKVKKAKEYVSKQVRRATALAERIKTASIAALPIPTKISDAQTKEEAAKEKINAIKEYKAKLDTLRKQGQALALVGRSLGPLLNNISSGKLKASDNERHLRNIADGRFKYQTVALKSDSTEYQNADLSKKKLLESIEILKVLETIVSSVVTVYKDIKSSGGLEGKVKQTITNSSEQAVDFGRGFLEDLKQAAADTVEGFDKQDSGDVEVLKNLKANRFVSLLVGLFDQEGSYDSVMKNLKRLRTELEGEVLTSLLISVNFTQKLVDLESKYLYQTQNQIRRLLGALAVNENESNQDETEPLTAAGRTQAALNQSATTRANNARSAVQGVSVGGYNIYRELQDLDRLITKRQGSFLAATIDRLLKLVSQFEEVVRKEISEWVNKKKEELKEFGLKLAEQHKVRLEQIKDKIANKEAVILSSLCGLSARLFWAGATWSTPAGTTFQVVTIGSFPRLKSNGFVDGADTYIREIADNFEKQLNGMVGIVYPNPAFGIPPFQFRGYK
jgi:hypothetical protein